MRDCEFGYIWTPIDTTITVDELLGLLGWNTNDPLALPPYLVQDQNKIETPEDKSPMNTASFRKEYKKLVGPISKESDEALLVLLREIGEDPEFKDRLAEVAFVLATVWWETHIPRLNQRFVPCIEQPPTSVGRVKRNVDAYFEDKYGPKVETDPKTGKTKVVQTAMSKRLGNLNPGDGEKFRSRGYIPIAGRDNYTRIGRATGDGDFLVHQPWAANVNPFAYKILSVGMRVGAFTGKKLSDFRAKHGAFDFVGARAIVIGKDKKGVYPGGAEIAEHAEAVYRLLIQDERKEAA